MSNDIRKAAQKARTSSAPAPVAQPADMREALQAARDALEEIAMAGMSGTGQESEDGMRVWHARRAWEFIGIAARALDPIRDALDAAPAPVAQGEPVAWWIPKAEQFCIAKQDGSRPFAKAWEPLYAAPDPVVQRVAEDRLIEVITAKGMTPYHQARAVERACAEAWGIKLIEATGQEGGA